MFRTFETSRYFGLPDFLFPRMIESRYHQIAEVVTGLDRDRVETIESPAAQIQDSVS